MEFKAEEIVEEGEMADNKIDIFYPTAYENLSQSDKDELWTRRANLVKTLYGRSKTLTGLLESRFGKSGYYKKMEEANRYFELVREHLTKFLCDENGDNRGLFYQDEKHITFTREKPLLRLIKPEEIIYFTQFRDAIDDLLYSVVMWRIIRGNPADMGFIMKYLQEMRNIADTLVKKYS